MESIIAYFNALDLDLDALLKTGAILLLGTLLISLFGRFIFGKKSALNNAVSSAIGILFIYALTVVLKSTGNQFQAWTAPLPFVTVLGDELRLFSFTGADYTVICAEVLSMIILSFLVNIVDGWLPRGKHILGWVFFRCLTVIIASILHLIATRLLTAYLPEGIVTYAPPILLALLVLMLLTGALKILVGVLLSTVNPLIAALYTFFFANVVGKQITKAVLTTTLLVALILLLQYVGVTAVSITSAALTAYIPFIVALIVLWYVVGHIL